MLLSPLAKTPTILLVEHEPHRRAAMAEYLGGSGYAVVQAVHAQEAITTLEQSEDVQVVVADLDAIDPPGGLRFAFEVHHRWPRVGMVITSGRVRHLRPDEVPGDAFFVPRPLPVLMLLELVRAAAHLGDEPAGDAVSLAPDPIWVH